MDPLLGATLGGRYLVRKRIGERDRARLYSAEDTLTGRPVVATVVSPSRSEAGAFERFDALAKRAVAFNHPACTVIRDSGRAPDGMVFVVEEGEVWHELEQELVLKGRLPVSRALDLAVQLLQGLDHLHGLGLCCGRLSTKNLRLAFDASGALKLQIPMAEVVTRGLVEEDAASPSDGPQASVADLQAATMILAQMLTGETGRDAAGTDAVHLDQLELEDDRRGALEAIIERGLGRRGHPYLSASELRRDIDALGGSSRFGRYDILHRMAVGGMGEIYMARAVGIEGVDINRLCVIKTVRTSLVGEPEFVERFLAEARVVASLSHGNIVPVYDVGKVGGVFYIAMEYVAGKDLRQVLSRAAKEKKRVPVPLALFIAKELANGLAYAHRAKVQGIGGLVHRDVSPHNTLVSYEGEVKLIDFGLAKVPKGLTPSNDWVVMGKVCYLSPEQARGRDVDQRTDIYSAGLVLFELLTGQAFFNQPTVEEVLDQVGSPSSDPPSARVSDIPAEVDRICQRAMAPRREDRYLSAAALRDDLTAELARIAPRTNPEEVGAFVRELFGSEQEDERILLSDLSLTLPPMRWRFAEDGRASPGERDDPTKQALSLMGRSPTPIHLAATVVGPEWAMGEGVPLAPSASGPAPAPEQVPLSPPPQQRATGKLPEGPLFYPVLVTEQVTRQAARGERWRWPLAVGMVVVLFAIGGVMVGQWLGHERETASRAADRAAMRTALAEWTKSSKPRHASSPVPSVTEGGAPQPARRDAAGVAPTPRTRGRPHPNHAKRSTPEPSICFVTFSGCDGCKVTIDGEVLPGRLPFVRPWPLDSTKPHRVMVRQPPHGTYEETLKCLRPGEELRVRLRIQLRSR
jgi:serine/threonine protein kinase